MGTARNRQQRTRAQRRAAERAQTRARPIQRKSGGISASMLGGIVTVLIIAGILGYVIYSNSQTKPGALNVAADLNPQPNQLAVGQTAPNFTLKDVNGKKYTLDKQRGHPVLLEFFAVWCPNCQAEAPAIAQLTKTYGAKGVRVWSILSSPYGPNYDKSLHQDTTPVHKADLSWFASTFNVTHPQLIDPNFHVVNEYGITAYPGLYVIDPNGKVVFSQSGTYPYSSLSTALNKALKVKSNA
jgi:peroxiredoxin